MATHLAPLPAPPLDPGLPELVPVFPLSDLVFPSFPASFSVLGLAFPDVFAPGVPCSLSSFGVPLSALPASPAVPPPLPPGATVSLSARSMESGITSPGALLAADAEPTRQIIPTVATPTESIEISFMIIPFVKSEETGT